MLTPDSAAQLQRLASAGSFHHANNDPELDPSVPSRFNVAKWAKMILKSMDDHHIPRKRTGVCFQDLSVTGSGPSVNIQKNVFSILSAPFRLNEWINVGNQNPRLILHDFNGVVKSGEILVVLGRPGSGCTTFLKTTCGHLEGLQLKKDVSINYSGE